MNISYPFVNFVFVGKAHNVIFLPFLPGTLKWRCVLKHVLNLKRSVGDGFESLRELESPYPNFSSQTPLNKLLCSGCDHFGYPHAKCSTHCT